MLKKLIVGAAFVVCSSTIAESTPLAIPMCNKPDVSFASFLKKFEQSAAFRESRIEFPLVSRQGDGVANEARIALWTKADVRALKYPLIYSQAERQNAHLGEEIVSLRPEIAEVSQANIGEADDTRLLYRFHKTNGCWALEEVNDFGQ